ncbi:MAG: SH3 domain-containing protein, partial [Sneathiella sp.]
MPLPRFVSLSSNKVNVRTGPGTRYPITWVFVRRGWPVEVIAEYELWRRIRDVDGSTGWVHKGLLSSRRTLIIT